MATPDLDFDPGTPIAGQYRIIEKKASGANGVVYSAVDNDSKKRVALKFLKEYPHGDDLDSVFREIGLGQLVNHPNVCKLHRIGTDDGVMFLSMEYVDGPDLEDLLVQCGHPSKDDAIRKAIEICSGLGAIHEKDVVHRDLKPANVMIDKQGHAKITDLGVAVPANLRTVTRGTPLYMAPEQWLHERPRPSADIYSLGLLLFKLFTGKTCLEFPASGSVDDILAAHAVARARRPSKENTSLDASIDHIISLCLAEKPGDRRNALHLRSLLQSIQP